MAAKLVMNTMTPMKQKRSTGSMYDTPAEWSAGPGDQEYDPANMTMEQRNAQREAMARGGSTEQALMGEGYVNPGAVMGMTPEEIEAARGTMRGIRRQMSDENPYGAPPSQQPTMDTEAARRVMASLRPQSYKYKDEGSDSARRPGIMAQDMEKTPEGAAIVEQTPMGKAINLNRAVSLSLASQADMQQRLKNLESSYKKSGTPKVK